MSLCKRETNLSDHRITYLKHPTRHFQSRIVSPIQPIRRALPFAFRHMRGYYWGYLLKEHIKKWLITVTRWHFFEC